MGLEPTRPEGQQILSLTRLPIPPPRLVLTISKRHYTAKSALGQA